VDFLYDKASEKAAVLRDMVAGPLYTIPYIKTESIFMGYECFQIGKFQGSSGRHDTAQV